MECLVGLPMLPEGKQLCLLSSLHTAQDEEVALLAWNVIAVGSYMKRRQDPMRRLKGADGSERRGFNSLGFVASRVTVHGVPS